MENDLSREYVHKDNQLQRLFATTCYSVGVPFKMAILSSIRFAVRLAYRQGIPVDRLCSVVRSTYTRYAESDELPSLLDLDA